MQRHVYINIYNSFFTTMYERDIRIHQVADKGRAIRYNISSALPLHDEGMMTGAFLSCTLDPNLLLE